ncbi:MAG: hypothetical protein B7C24_13825 [Bacteroidetes bacterium 4572_77]|nr:MAG: hypothetical protein B7C24_13825 [Bacteroidetes bacterium 4572_77]
MRKLNLIMAFVLCGAMFTIGQNASDNASQQKNSLATSQGVSGSVSHQQNNSKAFGDVITQIDPTSIHAWGAAFDGTFLYFTDPYGSGNVGTTVYQYDLSGAPTGYTIDANVGAPTWVGDMASDNGLLYCTNVGGDNAINVFNISSGSLVNTITGDWTGTSQRGLAHDAVNDEFYIGGWNSNTLWRVDATGTTISELAFPGISGLAWSPNGGPMGNGSLWVVANSVDDLVTELDPNNGYATLQSFVIPDGAGSSGAGLMAPGLLVRDLVLTLMKTSGILHLR